MKKKGNICLRHKCFQCSWDDRLSRIKAKGVCYRCKRPRTRSRSPPSRARSSRATTEEAEPSPVRSLRGAAGVEEGPTRRETVSLKSFRRLQPRPPPVPPPGRRPSGVMAAGTAVVTKGPVELGQGTSPRVQAAPPVAAGLSTRDRVLLALAKEHLHVLSVTEIVEDAEYMIILRRAA